MKNLARFLYILLVSLIKNKIIMKPFNLEEYLANPTKKVVTRDGRNVRIICTDRKGTDFPIVGLVTTRDYKTEDIIAYTKDGEYLKGASSYDLFFAPEKYEGWVNVYMNCNERNLGILYSSKEDALEVAKLYNTYVATVKIEWEE